jgi:hypothetical protein
MTIEGASVILTFIAVAGCLWAHSNDNEKALWLFGGVGIAAILLLAFATAVA